MRFLDEYKRLDRICADMYSCRNGVSEYLTQMEQTTDRDQNLIASWDSDYRTLKRLRWLRNCITHDTASTECSENDLENLLSFHNRILNRQDPLSVIYKIKQMTPTHQQYQNKRFQEAGYQPTKSQRAYQQQPDSQKKMAEKPALILLWIVPIIAVLSALLLLYFEKI